MSVLMTGGTSLLGLHLLREQLAAGRHVTMLAHARNSSSYQQVEHFLAATASMDRLPAPLHKLLAVVEIDLTDQGLGLSKPRRQALAGGGHELWHLAGAALLSGDDDEVWRQNVVGTENVLRLAAYLPERAPLRYASTAFVAGQLRQGSFREKDSGEVTEFENNYERSKHTTEGLVRQWANRYYRNALILRPSILVPGPGPSQAMPEHPMRDVAKLLSRIVRRSTSSSRQVLRVGADPRGFLNLVQVDWAALTMLRFSAAASGPRTDAVHVVHPKDTPTRSVLGAFEDVLPVRLRISAAPPAEATLVERTFYRRGAGFLPYLYHRRRFDGSAQRRFGVQLTAPPLIDRPYLRQILANDLAAAEAAPKTPRRRTAA